MPRYLLFTLAAPMASFGAVAVGERRPTWDRPSKSQILGLVAGALGIERAEAERHKALASSLRFAVRVDLPGALASDYHTAQVPPARRKRRFPTRADELGLPKAELKTILSRREFLIGSLYTIALWEAASGTMSLDDIEHALTRPVFAPFAGRKAHVLMLPMDAQVYEAVALPDAFAAYDKARTGLVEGLWQQLGIRPTSYRPIFADADAAPGVGIERIEERRDVPESRDKWRFGLRTEVLLRESHNPGGIV
jgi:CRISPR system Cascade subunit CasD